MSKYAQRIREIRQFHNLTQPQFAEKIGTTKNQISKYELEKEPIPVKHIIKICEVFNISANWLLGLSDKIDLEQGSLSLRFAPITWGEVSPHKPLSVLVVASDCIRRPTQHPRTNAPTTREREIDIESISLFCVPAGTGFTPPSLLCKAPDRKFFIFFRETKIKIFLSLQ